MLYTPVSCCERILFHQSIVKKDELLLVYYHPKMESSHFPWKPTISGHEDYEDGDLTKGNNLN